MACQAVTTYCHDPGTGPEQVTVVTPCAGECPPIPPPCQEAHNQNVRAAKAAQPENC